MRLIQHTAQKAWIALEITGIPYEFKEIGLYGPNGKPAGFWELNPKGTVPVLDLGNGEVWADSDLILDQLPFLPREGCAVLQPSSPSMEELVRTWRQGINQLLPLGQNYIPGGRHHAKPLVNILDQLNGMVVGPYLCGSEVTVADCAAFPFIWRLQTEVDFTKFPKLLEWIKYCERRNPAIQKTVQSSWWWWWW